MIDDIKAILNQPVDSVSVAPDESALMIVLSDGSSVTIRAYDHTGGAGLLRVYARRTERARVDE